MSINNPLAKASHMVKPNINEVEKYISPLIEITAKSQNKGLSIGKSKELKAIMQSTAWYLLCSLRNLCDLHCGNFPPEWFCICLFQESQRSNFYVNFQARFQENIDSIIQIPQTHKVKPMLWNFRVPESQHGEKEKFLSSFCVSEQIIFQISSEFSHLQILNL